MYKKILVAIDMEFPDQAEKLLSTAFALGQDDTKYFLLSLIPPVGGGIVSSFLPKNYNEKLKSALLENLNDLTKKLFPDKAKLINCLIKNGTIYEEINRFAKQNDIDLIIVKATKPNCSGLGPNSARVARNSGKSVLIVRD